MIYNKIRYGILIIALNLLCMGHAAAEGQAPFMEGGLAFVTTNIEASPAGHERSSVNTTVFIYRLGLPVLDYYAVEFMIGSGLSSENAPIGKVGINSLLGADFKASYPFAKRFEVFARGGLARIAIDVTDINVPGVAKSRDIYSDFGITLGVGGVYDMGKFGKIYAEYQRLPNVDLDILHESGNEIFNIGTQTYGFALGYQFFIQI